jgi:hypothetical protein
VIRFQAMIFVSSRLADVDGPPSLLFRAVFVCVIITINKIINMIFFPWLGSNPNGSRSPHR